MHFPWYFLVCLKDVHENNNFNMQFSNHTSCIMILFWLECAIIRANIFFIGILFCLFNVRPACLNPAFKHAYEYQYLSFQSVPIKKSVKYSWITGSLKELLYFEHSSRACLEHVTRFAIKTYECMNEHLCSLQRL